jgi:hypothetical protein
LVESLRSVDLVFMIHRYVTKKVVGVFVSFSLLPFSTVPYKSRKRRVSDGILISFVAVDRIHYL